MTKLYTALAILLASTLPSFADEPVTKWQWGCEWQQADNGNYWFKTDGGCKHYLALGYSTMADYNKDVKPEAVDEDDSEEPSDPGDEGTDPGEGPGDDNAGPGDDGGNGADPGDNGGEGPGTEGPSKPGKGKGKGRPGRGGKGGKRA